MNDTLILKALADETRMRIVKHLLHNNYCVRALSRKLGITEAAVSQHLKVLKEVELLIGKKKGYFKHYEVDRSVLYGLAHEIEALASIEREVCTPERGGCHTDESSKCHVAESDADMNKGHECCREAYKSGDCSDTVKERCHRHDSMKEGEDHEHCRCRKS